MKHRLIYLLLVGVAILSALGAFFADSPHASASGEDYVVYYKTGGLNDASAALSSSNIYARNGVFGKGLTVFSPVTGSISSAQEYADARTIINHWGSTYSGTGKGYYLGSYKCNGTQIDVLIGLVDQVQPNQFASTQQSVSADIWVVGSPTGALGATNGQTLATTMPKCMPGNINTTKNINNPKHTSLPLYFALSPAQGNDWFQFLKANGQNPLDPNASLGSGAGNVGGSSGDGDNSPTCESSGFNFSWALCPIFNELSNASSWILQNIVEPFLITPPISTNPQDPSFQIWSNLRIYGDIFLIIALLVIVFGESIGGGMIDAYTAKKVLPRLLVAAVLINLSIYLVAFLVDVSNILGKGIGQILTAPLTHCSSGSGNCWDFHLSLPDQVRVFSVGIIGFVASSTAILGFLGAIIFNPVAGITAAMTMAFFVLLPMFFAILAVFITLILRKGLILMLVLISPVAFALYCLPNTERFFKRWWDLLIEALMVYPIVIAIFGIADILSVTILSANGISSGDLSGGTGANPISGNLNRTLALLVAFLLQFLPLLAVPFAFRFAGGALSKIYEAATGAGQRINQLAENRREIAKRDYQARAKPARARMYHASRDWGDRFNARHRGPLGRVGMFAARAAGNRAGGYHIEQEMSELREDAKKRGEQLINNGRDEEVRGLLVYKRLARSQKQAYWNQALNDGAGAWAVSEGGRALRDEEIPDYGFGTKNGQTFFQSGGGAWIGEGDVDRAHQRDGRNPAMQQFALDYEMRKAITDGQKERLESQYMETASGAGGWGMTTGEAQGSWLGSGFVNQGNDLRYKYSKGETRDGRRIIDYNGFVQEVYEKRNSSAMAQMDARAIDTLTEAWERANDPQSQARLRAIAETMEYGMAGRGNVEPGEGGDVQPIPYGSAHTTQAMQRFINRTRGR